MWQTISFFLLFIGAGVAATYLLEKAIEAWDSRGNRGSGDDLCPSKTMDMSTVETLTGHQSIMFVDVKCCARCGGDHDTLGFRKMKRPSPVGDTGLTDTHWGQCPETGEPVFLGVAS